MFSGWCRWRGRMISILCNSDCDHGSRVRKILDPSVKLKEMRPTDLRQLWRDRDRFVLRILEKHRLVGNVYSWWIQDFGRWEMNSDKKGKNDLVRVRSSKAFICLDNRIMSNDMRLTQPLQQTRQCLPKFIKKKVIKTQRVRYIMRFEWINECQIGLWTLTF